MVSYINIPANGVIVVQNSTERNSLLPAIGSVALQLDNGTLYYFDGNSWEEITAASTPLAIGDAISGGTSGYSLYVDSNGDLAQQDLDTIYLPLAGGTMSGSLVLAGTPILVNEATTKAYVDSLFGTGLSWKDAAETSTEDNGDIDLTNPGTDTFSGHTISNGERLLVNAQSDPTENGIYIFDTSSTPLVRSSDANTTGELQGATISVALGNYAGQVYRQATENPNVGVDPIVWINIFANILVADGVTLQTSGNVISIANGGILDVHVNAAAAIQGTKISPDFGSQFVSSLGGASFETLELQNNGADTAWLGLPFASVPTPSASVTKVFSEGLNTLSFLGDGFYAKFSMGSFSADRTFTLPNASGIVGLVPSAGFVTSNGSVLSSAAAIDLTTDVTGVLPVANGGTNNASLDPESVPFVNTLGTQVTSDVTALAFDGTNLGIGNDTTPMRLTVGGGANPSSYANRDAQGAFISGSNIGISKLIVENTFGSSLPSEIALSSRPGAAMGAFEDLGQVSFFGQDNASNQQRGAYIRGITSGAWTSTSLPTHMDFFTVPSGSASEIQRARIHSSGEMYVGSTGLVGSTGTFNIGPLTSAKIGLYIRGQSGQTADLLQVQNNSAVTLMNVEADGDLNARSLKAAGSSGTGFLELNNQFIGILAPSSAIRVYSNGGNLAVKTTSPTYTFDHSLLTTSRTFQFQDSDYIIANVPAVIGPVKSTGSDLTAGLIDLTTEITGTLPIANGGTGSTSIAAGVVTSNGSSLSSFFRETLITNSIQSVATTTPTTLTELTTSSLATGTYKFEGVLIYQSTLTTVGVGFRINAISASMSSCFAKWNIAQAANGVSHDFEYDQLTPTTNVTSTATLTANTNALVYVNGVFVVSSAGTCAIQMRSETGSSVSIRAGSYITIEKIA